MTETTGDPPRRAQVRTGSLVHAFLDPHLPAEQLKEQAKHLLSREDLQHVVTSIGPEKLQDLADKLNQVCHSDWSAVSPIGLFIQ